MPVTTICGIIGALSISAFPLTSGFISKSMINETAAVEQLMVVWFLLTAASAGVFLHAGIKYPWFVFFHKDSGLRPRDPPINMQLAMILLSGLSLGLGVWPEPLYAMLPFPVDYRPYTGPHVVNALQLLFFSGLAFFILLPQMKRTLTLSLDLDWGYRKLGWVAALMLGAVLSSAQRSMEARLRSRLRALLDGLFRHHGPQGILARTWPTGSMVLWVAVLLAAYLVFYYA